MDVASPLAVRDEISPDPIDRLVGAKIVDELPDMIHVSRGTIQPWMKSGKLERVPIGRRVLIPRDSSCEYKRAKPCIFCGEHKTMSNEHIIPVWLQAHLGIEKDLFISRAITTGIHGIFKPGMPSPIKDSRIDRLHAYSALVCGLVCTTCNNGWMRQLEDNASPLLKKLISVARKLGDLSDPERNLIAPVGGKDSLCPTFSFQVRFLFLPNIRESLVLHDGPLRRERRYLPHKRSLTIDSTIISPRIGCFARERPSGGKPWRTPRSTVTK